jgi:hypothetical protein
VLCVATESGCLCCCSVSVATGSGCQCDFCVCVSVLLLGLGAGVDSGCVLLLGRGRLFPLPSVTPADFWSISAKAARLAKAASRDLAEDALLVSECGLIKSDADLLRLASAKAW